MIALTIDCEQWVGPLLRGKNVPENNNVLFSRKGNETLLKIFDEFDIKATFFVTGYFAQKEPKQVKKILSKGHEIASHGYSHYYKKRNFNLKKDIQKSKELIEQIIGKELVGFRAPQMRYSIKLLRLLDKLGFGYDSSLHPAFVPGKYFNIKSPLHIHKPLKEIDIKEIPAGVMPYTRLPISWVWMRNIGVWWTNIGVNMLLSKNITPNIYFHSWDFAEMNSKHVPFYITRGTGERFCNKLIKFLKIHKKQKFISLNKLI